MILFQGLCGLNFILHVSFYDFYYQIGFSSVRSKIEQLVITEKGERDGERGSHSVVRAWAPRKSARDRR